MFDGDTTISGSDKEMNRKLCSKPTRVRVREGGGDHTKKASIWRLEARGLGE